MNAIDLGLINLTAILISLAMVIAPHAVHLPTWIPALVAVVLLARFYVGWRHRKHYLWQLRNQPKNVQQKRSKLW